MLSKHPHVKYIRICEKLDSFGRPHDVLVIDTDIPISNETNRRQKDVRLIDLALEIKDFQKSVRTVLGNFTETEIHSVS